MSKRVLILSASPRKCGNSDTLCDQFMKGAIEASRQVEKVFLAEKKINYCRGCCGCAGNGECVQKDDMSHILDSMMAAGTASQLVGYLRASQVSRESSRFFGNAPTRDIARLRQETRLWI